MEGEKAILVLSCVSSSGTDTADNNSILSDKRFVNCNLVHITENYQSRMETLEMNFFHECYVLSFIPSDEVLAEILRVLIPKGKLLLEKQIPDRVTGQNLCSDLQIAGFIDTMAAKDPTTGERFVVCQKPSWTTNESAAITITESVATTATSSKWKMNLNDLAESDLVDEDELLDDGITIPANAPCGEASTKRRACKDCTCGFAEEIEAESAANTLPKKSSCGNCYKGDAFRCASCPFLGKPAFEPNSNKVVLAGMDDL